MSSPFLQIQAEEAATEKGSENTHCSLLWSHITQAKYQSSHITGTTGNDGAPSEGRAELTPCPWFSTTSLKLAWFQASSREFPKLSPFLADFLMWVHHGGPWFALYVFFLLWVQPEWTSYVLGPWVTAMKLSCPFQSLMWDPIRILMPYLSAIYILNPAFTFFAFVYLPASRDRFTCLLGILFSHLLLFSCSILIQLFCRIIQWSTDPWCLSLKTRHPNLFLQEHRDNISQWNIYQ